MKVIFFTTCKPFLNDDAWRQEQAIKSWTLLNVEKKIIIIGNDYGTKEICEKYNLIHEPDVKTLHNVPYLHEMFLIANKYANQEDVMVWTNSDMIYNQTMIDTIMAFKMKFSDLNNYLLVGQRFDWDNPKVLDDLSYEHFTKYMNTNKRIADSTEYKCTLHAPCGIDYLIHSKTTIVNNIDTNLVIAGTRHDMILLGSGLKNNYFTCDVSATNVVIHQNHGYKGVEELLGKLKNNNNKCQGIQRNITECKYKSIMNGNTIQFVKR
jgi:hypothetical protein